MHHHSVGVNEWMNEVLCATHCGVQYQGRGVVSRGAACCLRTFTLPQITTILPSAMATILKATQADQKLSWRHQMSPCVLSGGGGGGFRLSPSHCHMLCTVRHTRYVCVFVSSLSPERHSPPPSPPPLADDESHVGFSMMPAMTNHFLMRLASEALAATTHKCTRMRTFALTPSYR